MFERTALNSEVFECIALNSKVFERISTEVFERTALNCLSQDKPYTACSSSVLNFTAETTHNKDFANSKSPKQQPSHSLICVKKHALFVYVPNVQFYKSPKNGYFTQPPNSKYNNGNTRDSLMNKVTLASKGNESTPNKSFTQVFTYTVCCLNSSISVWA